MKIINVEKSFELCAEAGWYGYEAYCDVEITPDFIYKIGRLGQLTFLNTLKNPFFRVETHEYSIKGVQGNKQFRIGICRNDKELLNTIIGRINDSAPA